MASYNQAQIRDQTDLTFQEIITRFEYQINMVELKIDDIFVKHFNSDIYFRPQNVH